MSAQTTFGILFATLIATSVASTIFPGDPASNALQAVCSKKMHLSSAVEKAVIQGEVEEFRRIEKAILFCSVGSGKQGIVGDILNFISAVIDAINNNTIVIVQDLIDAANEFLEAAIQLPGIIGQSLVDSLNWIIEILTGLTPAPTARYY